MVFFINVKSLEILGESFRSPGKVLDLTQTCLYEPCSCICDKYQNLIVWPKVLWCASKFCMSPEYLLFTKLSRLIVLHWVTSKISMGFNRVDLLCIHPM